MITIKVNQVVFTENITENILQSVPPLQHGVRSLGLEHRFELRSNNTMRQWESKFRVVHLLDVRSAAFTCRNDLHLQDLDGAGTSTMTGSHVTVTLSDGTSHSDVPIFSVHVMGSTP